MKATIILFISCSLILTLGAVFDDDQDWNDSPYLVDQEPSHLRVARTLQPDGELDPKPDAWIVEFLPDTKGITTKAEQIARRNGGQVGFVYQNALKGFVFHGKNIQGIAAIPFVQSITRDTVDSIAAQTVSTGINRIFAPSKSYIKDSRATCFCDAVVAVIDTGVDFTHIDLNVNRAKSVDCTVGSCVPGGGNDDHNQSHGTHVAGIIGAINNTEGVVGVCPGAEIWAVKVVTSTGSGFRSWLLAGLDYVTKENATIDVVNMSLGSNVTNNVCSVTLCNAIGNATKAGIAFAVAAGNYNRTASLTEPACCTSVLTVSALADSNGLPGGTGANTCARNKDDTLAGYSNYGSAVDIAAPGDCIRSTTRNNATGVLSGTSFASPHVAGALAVLASNNHSANVFDMYSTITSNGNFGFIDNANDTFKEPLLDMTNLPDAKMVGITCPTPVPTRLPTKAPTSKPTRVPTKAPTDKPTSKPTRVPTKAPTSKPTRLPTKAPTGSPSSAPSTLQAIYPAKGPSKPPTRTPTRSPTKKPTTSPTKIPTMAPARSPTMAPTRRPTMAPTRRPSKPK